MIEITNLEVPSPSFFNTAIRGMRNAFKSWDKRDSGVCANSEENDELCYAGCPYVDHWEGEEPFAIPVCKYDTSEDGPVFILGKNDRNLLMSLASAGDPSHRKVLRQLPVIMEITAPLYWWKQMDQYKVGTVTNSESTMHTLTKREFTQQDFSADGLLEEGTPYGECHIISTSGEEEVKIRSAKPPATVMLNLIIDHLNVYRGAYLDTGDKKYWHAINKLLPQSYNQKRTWSANYEVILTIIKQRLGHKIPEWDKLIVFWLERVPFLEDLAIADGLISVVDGVVGYYKGDSFNQLYEKTKQCL